MEQKVFSRDEFVTSEWAGGTTTQLFIHPKGKLPQKLKRLKLEFVNVEAYEKIKVYRVTDRGHFEAAGSWFEHQ